MNKQRERLERAIVRISNHSYRPLISFRYFGNLLSLLSCKNLNSQIPGNVMPSITRGTISSLRNFSSGPSSFLSYELNPFKNRTLINNSFSGSCSILCFGVYSLGKKQSFERSSPTLPIKNHFSIISPSWFSSSYEIVSYSRYKPLSLCDFSSGRPKICSLKHGCYCICRCFNVSSTDGTINSGPLPVLDSEVDSLISISCDQHNLEKWNNNHPKFILDIVDILCNSAEDLESKLNMMSYRLSVYSITEVFKILNTRGISGLRFFEWIWKNNHWLRRNAIICSLIIDNVGRSDDYETMFVLLKAFTSEKICLIYAAFSFLPMLASETSSLNESTQRVVDLLNKVGGSCRNSGVHALIDMFCKLCLFEMARYVIKVTESKKSYYCLLIREKCKNGLLEDAYCIIREMQETHCAPDTTVYNYLLGSLWKNDKMDMAFALLNEMKANGVHPDAITFEILINFVCSLGMMDDAQKLLDQMASQGLKPRPTTHARVIKILFAAEKYEVVHEHVVNPCYKTCSNLMHSLLANLYREKGDILGAKDLLVEMMDMSLKPNFRIYVKIVKELRKNGRGKLARDLENKHSKFIVRSRILDV